MSFEDSFTGQAEHIYMPANTCLPTVHTRPAKAEYKLRVRAAKKRLLLLKWCHQESNRGHKDFQSFALPTELWHHYLRFCECKNRLFLNIKQIYGEKYFKYMVGLPKSSNFAPASTESSAVGSALRSGRRGRAFESPLSDLTDVPFKAEMF